MPAEGTGRLFWLCFAGAPRSIRPRAALLSARAASGSFAAARCSAFARADGTAMLRQALFAEYPAFFLCFRCTLRFFGGSTLCGAFRTGAFAARLQRLSALESPGLSYVAVFPERGIRGGVLSGIRAVLPEQEAFVRFRPGYSTGKAPVLSGRGLFFGAWPARTCCGVMPSRRLRDVPHPRAVLPPSARAEG